MEPNNRTCASLSDPPARLTDRADDHLLSLPGSDWRVWRQMLLRSAGFPATGLDLFSAPGLAAVVDAILAGAADAAGFDPAFDDAARALGEAVHTVAGDPRFREAMTWQNPGALDAVAAVLRDGPYAVRNERRRRREDIIAKYWQRYCGKNDTVGFFGPMCWTAVDPALPSTVDSRPGPGVVRRRVVFFEWWALDALARHLADGPGVRPWAPVACQPHMTVRGREVLFANRPPSTVPGPVATLLARCDGTSRAADLAAALTADGTFRRETDVYAQLEELAGRELVRWGFDLPMDLSAERVLRDHLARIDDPEARAWATVRFDRLTAARDAVTTAVGPEAVSAAMTALQATFEELTGSVGYQRPGQTYAGRTLCHLDTTRDLDITFGPAVLAKLAAIEPLLLSARWLTHAIAEVYRNALGTLYRDLVADHGRADVPFAELWFLAQGVLFGDRQPAEGVVSDFLHRWATVLDLADVDADTAEVRFTRADLTARVAAAFPAEAPGWADARLHSPDIHLCAPTERDLAEGRFTIVLGELHIGLAALNSDFFRAGHPDPSTLHRAMLADVPGRRVELVLPVDYPRHTARNANWMRGPDDIQLGIAPAPGADPARLVPVPALTVGPGPDGLLVSAADGRSWPVLEVFAELLGIHAFDTWKLAGIRGRTPRVVVDDLVLVRRTWRTTIGETGLATVTGERNRYLAARGFRRDLGLPERVFVRVASEIKPCFVDFTSPVYVRLFCTLLRGAAAKVGPESEVMITEMLPDTDAAWLTDADGHRYTNELRLHVRDPRSA